MARSPCSRGRGTDPQSSTEDHATPTGEGLATTGVREALLHAIALLELRRDALLRYADEIVDDSPRSAMIEGADRAESSAAVLRRLLDLPDLPPTTGRQPPGRAAHLDASGHGSGDVEPPAEGRPPTRQQS